MRNESANHFFFVRLQRRRHDFCETFLPRSRPAFDRCRLFQSLNGFHLSLLRRWRNFFSDSVQPGFFFPGIVKLKVSDFGPETNRNEHIRIEYRRVILAIISIDYRIIL